MIIDGLKIAQEIRTELAERIRLSEEKPRLCVLLVGHNPASLAYVGRKQKACAEVGIDYECVMLEDSVSEGELLSIIWEKNRDPDIHGVLVQLPLPSHIDRAKVVDSVSPSKDVDGFTESNVGKCFLGRVDGFLPCTPKGIMRLISRSGISVGGQDVTIVGYGDIVGKPLSLLLSNAWATVTVCHSKTRDIGSHTKNADIVVVAAGKPGLVTAAMIRPGAVVIDVGMNRVDGKIVGDTDFSEIEKIASITPVPGGVGPMTVAMLLENTYLSWERHRTSSKEGR